jgi:hypothetical protein
VFVGTCSAGLAWGTTSRASLWLAHGLWTTAVSVSLIWGWGAFANFRPYDAIGGLDGLGPLRHYGSVAVSLLILGLAYSGIPLLVGIRRVHLGRSVESVAVWKFRIASLTAIGASPVAIWLSRSHPTVNFAGVMFVGLLTIGFGIAAFGVTRGDRVSLGILLVASGSLGLYLRLLPAS